MDPRSEFWCGDCGKDCLTEDGWFAHVESRTDCAERWSTGFPREGDLLSKLFDRPHSEWEAYRARRSERGFVCGPCCGKELAEQNRRRMAEPNFDLGGYYAPGDRDEDFEDARKGERGFICLPFIPLLLAGLFGAAVASDRKTVVVEKHVTGCRCEACSK